MSIFWCKLNIRCNCFNNNYLKSHESQSCVICGQIARTSDLVGVKFALLLYFSMLLNGNLFADWK
jgi:hypothetical protein